MRKTENALEEQGFRELSDEEAAALFAPDAEGAPIDEEAPPPLEVAEGTHNALVKAFEITSGDKGKTRLKARPATRLEAERLKQNENGTAPGKGAANGTANGHAGSGAADEEVSPGRRLLLRLGVNHAPVTTPVEVAGETLFVRKLDAAGFQQVAVLSNRDGSGALNFLESDSLRYFFQAVILACVRMDAAGDVPFLSAIECWDLVCGTSEEARDATDVLMAKAIEINPDLVKVQVPDSAESAEAAEQEKKDSSDG